MRFSIVLFVLLVALLAYASGAPAKGSTKASLKKKPCLKECGEVYKPICAGDGTGKNNKSFGNDCVLSNYNCESGSELKVVSEGECPGGGGIRLS